MKSPIHYIEVHKSEKVIESLARILEEALSGSAKDVVGDAAFCTCTRIEKTDLQTILKSSKVPLAALETVFDGALQGNALIFMRRNELFHLGELMSGIEANSEETVPPEVMEGSLRFFETVLEGAGSRFGEKYETAVSATPPELLNPDGKPASLLPLQEAYQGILCITLQLILSSSLDFRVQILPHTYLFHSFMNLLQGSEPAAAPAGAATPPPVQTMEEPKMAELTRGPGAPNPAPPKPEAPGVPSGWNMDLLLDVELPIVVSFGETALALKDVLKLGVGSVIELDKTVNDPVTLIVNQKPIARGEVVMVEGNYGVRILEVESTADRIRSLG